MTAMGTAVVDRVPLREGDTVVDLGCGSGQVTAELIKRMRGGRLVAIDLSRNMIRAAASRLMALSIGVELLLVVADATRLPLVAQADLVFSTATFHWVLDHPALFRSIFGLLRPGGRLVAQCGGGDNMKIARERFRHAVKHLGLEEFLAGWPEPWEFATAETTRSRLAKAGFEEIATWVHREPVNLPDAESYRDYLADIVFRSHLGRLPEPAMREAVLDRLTEAGRLDPDRFSLDYWRLNIQARRPQR